MARRRTAALFVLVSPVLLFTFLRWTEPATGPKFPLERIVAVESEVWVNLLRGEKPIRVRCTDKQRIHELLEAIRHSVPAPGHKCAERGKVILKADDGESIVGILPGHDENFYEFRYREKLYKADRARFEKALKAIGMVSIPVD